MTVKISESAVAHLRDGYNFYEMQDPGAGAYFYERVLSSISDLATLGGIHAKHRSGYHRMICRPHPFAVFYEVQGDLVIVKAVLDCRQRPSSIRKILRKIKE